MQPFRLFWGYFLPIPLDMVFGAGSWDGSLHPYAGISHPNSFIGKELGQNRRALWGIKRH
jgi:hypothetical protein